VVKEVSETRATPKDIAQTAAKRENKEVTFMANTRKEEALEALAENPPLRSPACLPRLPRRFLAAGPQGAARTAGLTAGLT
jgi:hypothetical protein